MEEQSRNGEEPVWPTGVGAKGNEGVAGESVTRRAELVTSKWHTRGEQDDGRDYENSSGKLVDCTPRRRPGRCDKPELSASDFSIVDADGANSYPIAGYSWAIVYQNLRNKVARMPSTMSFRGWSDPAQQKIAKSLEYIPYHITFNRPPPRPLPDAH